MKSNSAKSTRGKSVVSVISIVVASTLGGLFAQGQTAAPAATSTTSASAAAAAGVNKFGVSLVSETGNNFAEAKEKGGAANVSAVILSYKPSSDWKLAITQVSDYVFTGEGDVQADQKAVYRDLSLSASTTYGSFLGTEKTPVKYIFNLPTSDDSITNKQAFSVSTEIILGYEVADSLSANVLWAPGLNVRNGPNDEFKEKINAELRYAYNDKLSNYSFVEHIIKAKTEASMPKVKEVASLGVGVSYSPSKFIDLDLSVSRDRYLFNSAANNKTVDFKFNDEKEISYLAGVAVKF